jgi:UDP-glucose 4-epimerase
MPRRDFGSMRFLITGGAGFIGSNLCESLAHTSSEIVVVDNLSNGRTENLGSLLEKNRVELAVDDARNLRVVTKLANDCDWIVHLAAYKIPKDGHAEETLLGNTAMGHAVFEGARIKDCKVLLASTSDVYGRSRKLPLNEDDDLVLGTTRVLRWSYAISKLFEESMAYAYARTYGVQSVILRYFNVYGPKENLTWRGGPQSVFIENILKSEPIVVHGDGTQSRCFTYVSDIVEATAKAIQTPSAVGEIINVGNDQTEISIKDLAKLIMNQTGTNGRTEIQYVPHETLFGEYHEVEKRVPDITKARKLLGFVPKVDLKTGLTKTIEWHKSLVRNK